MENIAKSTFSQWPTPINSPIENFYIVGYDLGAHIAGLAARIFEDTYGDFIDMITALDPSGYLFENDRYSDIRLSNISAVYVWAIHTNDGGYGISNPMSEDDRYTTHLSFTCETSMIGYEIPGKELTEEGTTFLRQMLNAVF